MCSWHEPPGITGVHPKTPIDPKEYTYPVVQPGKGSTGLPTKGAVGGKTPDTLLKCAGDLVRFNKTFDAKTVAKTFGVTMAPGWFIGILSILCRKSGLYETTYRNNNHASINARIY